MADNEEFTFEEEESFLEPGALEEPPSSEVSFSPSASEQESLPARRPSLLRILLLVLLLVILGGAACYYFVGIPEEAPPAPAVVQKKSIPVPAPPSAALAPVPAKASVPAAAALPPAKPEAANPPPSAPPEKERPAVSAKPLPATAAAPAASTAAPTAAPAAAPTAAPAAAPTAAPTAAVAAVSGHFTLRSGAYLLASSLAEVEKAVRRLGYQPVLTPVQSTVAMTRLRVGTYSPAGAEAKLAALASVAPDSFVLIHGGQATVYAGSYLVLDQARRYADHLYSQGIRVEEEPAMVEETLQRVSFGDFADRKQAEAAAVQARAANLEVAVVRHR